MSKVSTRAEAIELARIVKTGLEEMSKNTVRIEIVMPEDDDYDIRAESYMNRLKRMPDSENYAHELHISWTMRKPLVMFQMKDEFIPEAEKVKWDLYGIMSSQYMVVLATDNYAESVRDPNDNLHARLTVQIAVGRLLNKPFIIIMDEKIRPENEALMKEQLKDCDIIILEKVPLDGDGIKKITAKILNMLNEREAKK